LKKIFLITTLFASTLLQAKLSVIVSITPQVTFLEQIAKDRVDISLMVQDGKSAHSYTPKPSQMKSVSKADLYMAIGIDFENIWLNKFQKLNSNMIVVNTQDNIKKLYIQGDHNHEEDNHSEESHENEHHEDEHKNEHHEEENKNTVTHNEEKQSMDPHIWTSPANVKIMAKNILDALVISDNSNKDFYTNNYNDFINRITIMDNKIKSIFSKVKKDKSFMVFHPSWQYFAKEYSLIQLAIEFEGKSPKPRALNKLIKQAKENNIKIIFTSPLKSTKTSQIIASELGVKIIRISPMNRNWEQNLVNMANHIQSNK